MSTPTTPTPVGVTFPVEPEGIGPAEIAAWVFAPAPESASDVLPPLWLLCIPGGTYRGLAYYDRQIPGFAPLAYSMARVLAAQGIGSVVIDNLGTGESPVPAHVSGWQLSRQVYADAYRQLVVQIRERLACGRLVATLAPVDRDRLFLVGVGHSMGGMLATQLQASYQVCDALCLLSWATLTIPERVPGVGLDMAELVVAATPTGYLSQEMHAALRPFFFSPAVPPALLAADEQDVTVLPGGLLEGLQPRALCEQAAQISCPLYLGFTARDMTPDPQGEVAAYPSARSITLFVQPQAHHCANFEPTRFELWDDIVSWVRVKAVQAKGIGPLPLSFLEADRAATQPLAS